MSFSQKEKKKAIEFFFSKCLTVDETVRRLGYPSRTCLLKWLKKDPRFIKGTCLEQSKYLYYTPS